MSLYSLTAGTLLWEVPSLKAKVVKILATKRNRRYYVAYDDGTIDLCPIENFSDVVLTIENVGTVIDMVTNDQDFIVVSKDDGEVEHITFRAERPD